jgi:hypothetical protein
MNIKREARTQVEIAQIIRVLDIKDELCQRHTRCDKLAKRLDLAYRVVQTL